MKVVYQTCCGVDVHKSFLVATFIKTTSGVQPSYQKKRFSTFNNSILGIGKIEPEALACFVAVHGIFGGGHQLTGAQHHGHIFHFAFRDG